MQGQDEEIDEDAFIFLKNAVPNEKSNHLRKRRRRHRLSDHGDEVLEELNPTAFRAHSNKHETIEPRDAEPQVVSDAAIMITL